MTVPTQNHTTDIKNKADLANALGLSNISFIRFSCVMTYLFGTMLFFVSIEKEVSPAIMPICTAIGACIFTAILHRENPPPELNNHKTASISIALMAIAILSSTYFLLEIADGNPTPETLHLAALAIALWLSKAAVGLGALWILYFKVFKS